MKLILSALLVLSTVSVFAQDMSITVTTEGKSLRVVLDDDNGSQVLTLGAADLNEAENYLTAEVSNEEINKDWKRSFIIYDEEDIETGRLPDVKENTYRISLRNLKPLLQPGKEYALFTIISPKDPQKAMEVKIARQLVCKIKVLED